MDRRKSIKALFIGTVSTGVFIEACKPGDKKGIGEEVKAKGFDYNRMKEEQEAYDKIVSTTFFTPHEFATITILVDIIIPKDEISGSATDAKVPDFIEFIVKDMPEHQTPLRGGLRWLDLESFKRFDKAFTDITEKQRLEIVDDIAYPKKAKPIYSQGVSFFTLIRDLTATGFYTTEIGTKDVGYIGNQPNNWNGVPDDVLKQYGLAYSEKELKECVSFDKA